MQGVQPAPKHGQLLGPVWDTMPADLGYERETSRLRMTCRLEAGDWLYIPSGWWHIAQTQAASMHLSIGVMPVTRLRLFEFLTHYLAQFLVPAPRVGAARGTREPASAEHDAKSWEDMRTQLHDLLAHERQRIRRS